MKRLTKRGCVVKGSAACYSLLEGGLVEVIDKLKKYEDLEEQGRLLKLPCAAGDMVWVDESGRLCSYKITGFSFGDLNEYLDLEEMVLDQVVIHYINSDGSVSVASAVSEIGKTIFLQKSDAEQALKEIDGKVLQI